jgi:hypothetical protein
MALPSSVLVVALYGGARTVPRDNGPRAWVWVSGVEDGSFHPVDLGSGLSGLGSK